MSLTYDGTGGLFTDIGKLIKHSDLQRADAVNLTADQDEILDAFEAGDQDVAVAGIAAAFDQWRNEYANRRTFLAKKALDRLKDRATVLLEIGATSADQPEIIAKLIRQMIADSKTVNASSVSIGSVTPGGSNVGNGTFLVTKVLDGVTSPGSLAGVQYASQPSYRGRDSELCVPAETMTLRCTSDSYQSGATEGFESHRWEGKIPDQAWGVIGEGSGYIGDVRASTLLQNGDFESFTSSVPDSWTLDSGTAVTHVAQGTGSDAYHGSGSLRFNGDGSQAAIQVSHATPNSLVQATKGYAVHFRLKASATIAAGAFTCQFEGTGYSAGSSEKVSIAAGSLPTSFTLQSFFVNMPASIPSDFKLVLKWTGTPTNAKSLWIDDIWLQPIQWGGGLGIVPVRGSTPFVQGDTFTFTVANTEGVIQRFARRAWGAMLPSDNAAGENIADSLAT